MSQHQLFICTTCASTWKEGKKVGESGGEKLLQKLSQEYAHWPLNSEFKLQPVSCMSACGQSCAVSFAAPGKHTYLFGKLSSEDVSAVLHCASQYYEKSDGVVSWQERPEPLRKGIVARIPPLS